MKHHLINQPLTNADYTAAMAQWINERVQAGWDPYMLTFMFEELHCSNRQRLEAMRSAVEGVFRRFLTRVVRNPRNRDPLTLPNFIGCPDLPVRKRQKASKLDAFTNNGYHYAGILLMPPPNLMRTSRLGEPIEDHFEQHKLTYVGRQSRIDRIDVQPITSTPDHATDYVLKAIKNGSFDQDTLLILPRSMREVCNPAQLRKRWRVVDKATQTVIWVI